MTEVVSIASEKVTEILSMIEIPLWFSVGEIDETVGAVLSVVVVLSLDFESSSLLLQEIKMKLKSNKKEIMSMCLNCFPIRVVG